MNRVTVENVDTSGSTLRGSVTCNGRVGRFFDDEPFVAEYGVDVSDVPESILVIPLLAHVAPVAWANGATVRVDRADSRFLSSLRHVRETLCNMYPEFMQGGAIDCREPVEHDRHRSEGGRSAMLFTGGVDSMATYVRHRDEDPDLISVKGWVIRDEERWERNHEYFSTFAEKRGLRNHFVRSNMLEFLASPLLQAHFQRYLDGAWYSSVGHGLGMLGLCAPLTWATDIATLYIAATHTEEVTRPWGSHPDIDDHVRWSGTRAVHDGYDLTRQGKIETIAEYAEREDPSISLRTCTYSESPENCNDCEKCYRTIVGLLLAGLDPNEYGYAYDEDTLPAIREGFESGEWVLIPTKKYHWEIMQRRAEERSEIDAVRGDELREWLLQTDLEQYVERTDRPLRLRALQAAVRHVPTPVFSTLYPMYERLTD